MPLVIRDDFCNLYFGFSVAGDPEPMSTALGVRMTPDTPVEDQAIACLTALNAGHLIFATETPEEYTIGPGRIEIGRSAEENITTDGLTSYPGEQVADATQQNTAWLVRKSTTRGGRSGRGRMFVPGAVDSFVSPAGVLEPSYLAALQTLIESVADAILLVPDIEELVLFHEDDGPEPSPITSLSVDTRVATQRRRMR